MKRWIRAMRLTIAALALAGPAFAQPVVPFPEQRQAPDPPPSHSTEVSGQVKSMDGNLLTLSDGQRLVVMPELTAQTGDLKPGAKVKASYAETAGRKVATSIKVEPN